MSQDSNQTDLIFENEDAEQKALAVPSGFHPMKLTVKMALTAVLSALYVVLSVWLTFRVGKSIEISWITLPVLMAAVWLPFPYALSFALIGSFLEQALSPYGLMATTPLWMAPVVLASLLAFLFLHKKQSLARMIVCIVVCELFLTCANFGVQILDGILLSYSTEYLYPTIPFKLINCGIRCVMSSLVVPILERRVTPILYR